MKAEVWTNESRSTESPSKPILDPVISFREFQPFGGYSFVPFNCSVFVGVEILVHARLHGVHTIVTASNIEPPTRLQVK